MSGVVDLRIDSDGIAWMKMNDEKNKNIFSKRFVEDFLDTMDELENRNILPKVMVLQGLSDVFCAGADKDTLVALTEGKIVVKDMVLSERLLDCAFPVIAAVEGHAMGGGLAMVACCDIVIAARESRFGAVFMSMGFTPGMGTTTLLPELVGRFVATEMMLTAKRFKVSELERMGTNINRIVTKLRVMPVARDIARQIAEKNPKSVRLLKYTLSAGKKKLLTDARLHEDLMHQISFAYPETLDHIEDLYAD
jgi:polyketide biosynthesis enoyl-CoA hydratase PksI